MLHFLTIGYLDVSRIERRVVTPLKSAWEDVIPLASHYGFVDETTSEPINGCSFSGGAVRVPWFSPWFVPAAVKLAIQASKLGLVVADVEHGRVVDARELVLPPLATSRAPRSSQ